MCLCPCPLLTGIATPSGLFPADYAIRARHAMRTSSPTLLTRSRSSNPRFGSPASRIDHERPQIDRSKPQQSSLPGSASPPPIKNRIGAWSSAQGTWCFAFIKLGLGTRRPRRFARFARRVLRIRSMLSRESKHRPHPFDATDLSPRRYPIATSVAQRRERRPVVHRGPRWGFRALLIWPRARTAHWAIRRPEAERRASGRRVDLHLPTTLTDRRRSIATPNARVANCLSLHRTLPNVELRFVGVRRRPFFNCCNAASTPGPSASYVTGENVRALMRKCWPNEIERSGPLQTTLRMSRARTSHPRRRETEGRRRGISSISPASTCAPAM